MATLGKAEDICEIRREREREMKEWTTVCEWRSEQSQRRVPVEKVKRGGGRTLRR